MEAQRLNAAATGAGLVLANFYRFTDIDDPATLRQTLRRWCEDEAVLGTILIASEGINASLAGSQPNVDIVIERIRALPGCADIEVLFSAVDASPFRRLKIKIRDEIVTFGQAGVAPAKTGGQHLSAAEWNALCEQPNVLLIDARNEYEIKLGTFPGAQNPHTQDFRQFAQYVETHLHDHREQAIAMFCTGGIRCEKASAYLLKQGFKEVYQLDGGILRYLAETPRSESRWRGDCFVFDERIAVNSDLKPADYTQCYGCRRPLSAEDRASPLFEEGIACADCHHQLSDAQRAAFAERRRQVQLAEQRRSQHLGPQTTRQSTARD